MTAAATKRERKTHIWEREGNEHYVEPAWCSARLFAEEEFRGLIHDPCCGFGTIPKSAMDADAGYCITAADIVDRGYKHAVIRDFFDDEGPHFNVVCNPPFKIAPELTQHALKLAARKVAIIFPTACLNAAHRWLKDTPLCRIWLLTPRPSMPPGHVIAAGEKPKGGRADFCWLVFEHGYAGPPEVRWLHRDGEAK